MSWSELRGERGRAASPGWRFQVFFPFSSEGRTLCSLISTETRFVLQPRWISAVKLSNG